MGIIGKFISNAWNGIKNEIGTAGKLIQSGANKAWDFVKENQDTIGKLAGTALGTGLNLYTGGAAAPFISGANNFIQGLPDNAFTKHLKNIAKGAVFDYGQDSVPKDPEKKSEQTNAHTEYQAPRMSSFITPSSAVSSPTTVVRRTIVKQMPLKKNAKGKKAKGKKKSKGK